MVRHGNAPFLECSSHGDIRFSAFYARIRQRGNRTIEEIYQAAKILPDGRTNLGWRDAKGHKAVNADDCNKLYSLLWDEYMAENDNLFPVLVSASGLSDKFGQPGHCCQATELWRIRNKQTPRYTENHTHQRQED
jgi:hypothetical protein